MDKLVRRTNKLIVQIAGGKLCALDALYALTGKMLLAMANKYLIDKTYAEDLVSDVYLKIVRGASAFDKRKNGLNWIYKILRNAAIDFNRHDAVRAVAADAIGSKRAMSEYDIDDWLERILIKCAVDRLTEEEKQIVYMRYWEGLRLKEMAERLNKSVSTTHELLQKTLNKLKQYLK